MKTSRDPSLSEQEKITFDHLKKSKQFFCSGCGNHFIPSKPYQLRCSEKCNQLVEEKIRQVDDKQMNRTCLDCGISIRKTGIQGNLSYCHGCKIERQRISIANYQNKLPKKEQESKKRKKVSYDELVRRQEYKRVMDDHGWDHYLKGRKWDRI